MSALSSSFIENLPAISPIVVLDILLVTLLLYQFFIIIRGRRAVPIITGVLMLIGVYVVAVLTGMGLLRTILETVAPYSAFALIVMFQSDIRRILARIGRRRFFASASFDRRDVETEIALTLSALARQQTGALIVLEGEIGLRTFIESGVRVDGVYSRDLLLSIFHPGSAMHDGAVIIQGDRIAAAACFLPLSTNPRLMSTLGTRHRAAIGVTEETDCLALVVSEETGRISVAYSGEITTDLTVEDLERRIAEHYGRANKRPRSTLPSIRAHGSNSSKPRRKEAGRL